MAIIPSFTVGQSALTPNIVTITDTSTGSDVAITQRRVYVQTATGTYLVPSGTSTDYTQWSYADIAIALDILSQDQAVNILVQWLGAANNVLYTLNANYCLAEYNKQFFYYLIQNQALTPGITQDATYDGNSCVLWTSIVAAINAVEYGNDLAASQNCLNRATALRLNESYAF